MTFAELLGLALLAKTQAFFASTVERESALAFA